MTWIGKELSFDVYFKEICVLNLMFLHTLKPLILYTFKICAWSENVSAFGSCRALTYEFFVHILYVKEILIAQFREYFNLLLQVSF